MGNSADRAWQLSQLVEGVLTACNPSAWQPVLHQNKLRCCPRCWLFSCLGFEFPTPLISPKEHQKERCGHSRPQRSFITFSWCASEYSVVDRIPCHVPYDSTRTNVCQWSFAKKFLLLLLLNRIDSISNLYIFILLRWIFQRRITQRWKIQCRRLPSCWTQSFSHSSNTPSSSS